MSTIEPWRGAGLWSGAAMAGDPTWTVTLSRDHLDELSEAIAATRGLAVEAVTKSDFALPSLGPVLERILEELLNGRGFALLRGLPTETWSREEAARAYWGIGAWLGEAVSQNAQGDLLGHVIDQDTPARAKRRLYQTNQSLSFHSDSCDLVGLLCLKTAKAGGESRIASAAAVHNHLLEHAPDLLETLYGVFHCDRFGELPAGKAASYPVRIFNRTAEHLTCCGMDPDIHSAQRLPGIAPLTPDQRRALEAMQTAASALCLDMDLRPGDLQLLHNHTVLHARAPFEDHAEPEQRRHLLRLWLSARQGRPLPAFLAERWGTVEVGARRGGILVPGARPSVSLEPPPARN